MKTIGLLGGMSWESTARYYRLINEETRRIRGSLHSASLVLVSVDFQPISEMQHAGDWDACARELSDAARRVQAAGAEILLICTNTMHEVADRIAAGVDIPLLHLADATADAAIADGHGCVGLLGTKFTMERAFYKERLSRRGIDVIVPPARDRDLVHRVIYDELCVGHVKASSRAEFQRIIDDLGARGAAAVVAGCTEIGLLIGQDDTEMPVLDSTAIHAQRAVAFASG